MNEEIQIKDITRCQFQDGDLIVVSCPTSLPGVTAKHVQNYIQDHCKRQGWRCGVLVISGISNPVDVKTISPEEVSWIK